MIKKIGVAVSAAAIVSAGFVAFGTGTASAAGEDIDCTELKAKVTLTPALTMTPGVVTTTIAGKVKSCTATGLPAGVTLKGGSSSGSIAGTEPSTCDIGDLAGTSETDINLTVVWKTKGGSIPNTNITFTNRDGFTLPGATGTSIVTGTGAGKQVKIVGNAAPGLSKIIKKCYGKDGVAAPPDGKGVTKIKVYSGTVTST